MLRCDGTYIVALDRTLDFDDCSLSVWRLADVLSGIEEPLRSLCNDEILQKVRGMQFSAQAGVIVLQLEAYSIKFLHFNTFEVLYQANGSQEKDIIDEFSLHNELLLIPTILNFPPKFEKLPKINTGQKEEFKQAKLQLIDLSVPTNPKRSWKRKPLKKAEDFLFVFINDSYMAFVVNFYLYIYKRPSMLLLYRLHVSELTALNPHTMCFSTGNYCGHVHIWDFRKQSFIFSNDFLPIYNAQYSMFDAVTVSIRFLHLYDDKLLVQTGDGGQDMLTLYDFSGKPQIDYDAEDPRSYSFCIVLFNDVFPYFFVSARKSPPYWDITRTETRILPKEQFCGKYFLGNKKDQAVTLYEFRGNSGTYTSMDKLTGLKNPLLEHAKKGKKVLLSKGIKENRELGKNLIQANFIPQLSVYS